LRKFIVRTTVDERNSALDEASEYWATTSGGSTSSIGTMFNCRGSEMRSAMSGTTAVEAEEKAEKEGKVEKAERGWGPSTRRVESCEVVNEAAGAGAVNCPPAAEGMDARRSNNDGLMSQVGL